MHEASRNTDCFAAFETIAPAVGLSQNVSRRFLEHFLNRASNRFLVCLANQGDEWALEHLRNRVYKARIEARFWGYIAKYLRLEAQKRLARDQMRQRREALDLNAETQSGDGQELLDLLPASSSREPESEWEAQADPRDILTDSELFGRVAALTDRQWRVLYLTVVRGYPEREAARALGISQQAVSKTKRVALQRLRGKAI